MLVGVGHGNGVRGNEVRRPCEVARKSGRKVQTSGHTSRAVLILYPTLPNLYGV